MKNYRTLGLFVFILVSLLIISCGKDDGEGGSPGSNQVPMVPIQASVIGSIFDLQNQPIEGAQVIIGSASVLTDVNGVFGFRDVAMNEDGTLIQVVANGYFSLSKIFNPSATAISTVNIQLLEKTEVGSFSSSTGGDFTTNGNGIVSIPPNSIMSSAGTPYTGTVIISAHWLDPSSEKVSDQMPGDLRGFDEDGDIVQLATFGMMAVELSSPSGEKLNMLTGSEATITMEIPDVLLNNAPSSIPMWFMNEQTGYWEEEGQADKIGDMYVGAVKHFTFWNCDAPFPLIEWSQQFVDQNGNPLEGLRVHITVNSFGLTRAGLTNQNGFISGKTPKDELLTLSVFEPICNTIIHTQSAGPFNVDTNSPAITISPVDVKTVNLTGTVLDCNGFPVSNGVVKMSNSNMVFPINGNGSINVTFPVCTNSVGLILIDVNSFKQSQELLFSTPNQMNNINIGTESACFSLDEFITINVLSESYTTILPFFYQDLESNPPGNITSSESDPNAYMLLSWNGFNTGQFDVNYFLAVIRDENTQMDIEDIQCPISNCDFTVNVTLNEGSGGYVEGNFSGNAASQLNGGVLVPVSGSFRVRFD